MLCSSSGCAGVVPEVKSVGGKPAPLLRSRTLPAIVVPGLSILQAQIDARYKQGKSAECFDLDVELPSHELWLNVLFHACDWLPQD
jgi:hypothetical protein